MARVKEPKFISNRFLKNHYNGPGDDLVDERTIKSLNDYINLFSPNEGQIAIGEASADLLYYSNSSIPVIKELLGDNVKIIAILRNPVSRAFSAYTHMVRDGRETLPFCEALIAEQDRIKRGWEFIWHYTNAGKYYSQMRQYLESFSQVKIYLYEDLARDPLSLYKDLCNFLSVSPAFIPEDLGQRYNPSGIPRFKTIPWILHSDNIIKAIAKPIVPRKYRTLLNNLLFRINLRKDQMEASQKEYLINYFKDDVLNLSKLLGRDLSHWIQ